VTKSRSHLDLTIASINIFSNDGLLDAAELEKLLQLAERDGAVDEDEKRVLGKIFAQAEQTKLDPAVARRIAEIRRTHAIG
jgi:tellurite resistance protein